MEETTALKFFVFVGLILVVQFIIFILPIVLSLSTRNKLDKVLRERERNSLAALEDEIVEKFRQASYSEPEQEKPVTPGYPYIVKCDECLSERETAFIDWFNQPRSVYCGKCKRNTEHGALTISEVLNRERETES